MEKDKVRVVIRMLIGEESGRDRKREIEEEMHLALALLRWMGFAYGVDSNETCPGKLSVW